MLPRTGCSPYARRLNARPGSSAAGFVPAYSRARPSMRSGVICVYRAAQAGDFGVPSDWPST